MNDCRWLVVGMGVIGISTMFWMIPTKSSKYMNTVPTEQTARQLIFFDKQCNRNWWFENSCICNEEQLQTAVDSATNGIITSITVCRNSHIMLTTGIDLSNKRISIWCSLFLSTILSSSCTFDGMSGTHLFHGVNAQLTLHNLDLINGIAISESTSKDGGAIQMKDSTITIVGCNFYDNVASQGAGSAISVEGGTIEIRDTTFIDNVANDGGSIAMKKVYDALVTHSLFQNNHAKNGGAIIFNDCDVVIEATTFLNNTASSVVRSSPSHSSFSND
jgi:predicted outer membrane repeat protein